MSYPSTIGTFTNPLPTNRLNSPSHSGIETAQNTAIVEIETFVGTISSTAGSLMYDVRSVNSNGGGHVQTANKGGTGQTSFTKGDILVATGPSVLSKFAVGPDGKAIVADSTSANGLGYQTVLTAPVIQNQTAVYAPGSVVSASVYAIEISPAPSVLTAGQAFEIKWPTTNAGSILALTVSSIVAKRLVLPDLTNPEVGTIKTSMISRVEYDGTNFQITSDMHNVGTSAKQLVQLDGAAKLPAVDGSQLTNLSGSTLKSGTTTKNAADASTTQNIAHGLGKVPSFTRIFCRTTIATATGTFAFAEAIYNGTTQSSQSSYNDSGSFGNFGIDTTFSLNIAGGSNQYTRGVVTFDATNIIITWTKTGSPTGTYQIIWEAA